MYLAPAFGGRLEKLASWTFKNCEATEAEAATTTSTKPNRRCMRGPWVLANAASAWCGTGPMWGKFPMMGHGFGPGGRGREGLVRRLKTLERKMATTIVAKPRSQGDMDEDQWASFPVERLFCPTNYFACRGSSGYGNCDKWRGRWRYIYINSRDWLVC